jgi:hypothetical protein
VYVNTDQMGVVYAQGASLTWEPTGSQQLARARNVHLHSLPPMVVMAAYFQSKLSIKEKQLPPVPVLMYKSLLKLK